MRYGLLWLTMLILLSSVGGDLKQMSVKRLSSLPAPAWHWLPLPTSVCGNHTATGMGLSLIPASPWLVIYLQGGGACSSQSSCDSNHHASADHMNGFNENDFQFSDSRNAGLLNRNDPDNPLATANYAFVPYCTGDLHVGNNDANYGVAHKGWHNFGLVLSALQPYLKNVRYVLLAGSSAGAMGALWNWPRVQDAMAPRPVVLVADSPPLIGPPLGSFAIADPDPWHTQQTAPIHCPQCIADGQFDHGPFNLFGYFQQHQPAHRGIVLVSQYDHLLATALGFSRKDYAIYLQDILHHYVRQATGLSVFVWPGHEHALLADSQILLGGIKNGTLNFATVLTATLREVESQTLLTGNMNPKGNIADVAAPARTAKIFENTP